MNDSKKTPPKSPWMLVSGFVLGASLYLFVLPLYQNDGQQQDLKPVTASSPAHRNVRVMAHYMPWFKRVELGPGKTEWEHWQWLGKGTKHNPDTILENGQHDIASVHYPLIGPYDSQDVDVLEYHILTAKLAGIEAFMCNWYGPGSYTDKTVAKMLPLANKHKFKIGICLEEKAFFPPYSKAKSRDDVIGEMSRHVNYVLKTYSSDSAFLKQDGSPLLFIFNYFGEGPFGSNLLTREEIIRARSNIEGSFLLARNNIEPAQFDADGRDIDGVFLWCAEQSKRAEEYAKVTVFASAPSKLAYRAAVASPGFNDEGVHGWGNVIRKIDRREAAEFKDNWDEAIASNFNAIQIVTWNDFQEGSTIEPTVEYGFQYVNEAELQIEAFTKRKADVTDNSLGLDIYNLRKSIRKISNELRRKQLTHKVNDLAINIFEAEKSSSRKLIERLKDELNGAVSN